MENEIIDSPVRRGLNGDARRLVLGVPIPQGLNILHGLAVGVRL